MNNMNGSEKKKNPAIVVIARVSSVEVAGFEPAAFWSRTISTAEP
jgi:hypothetical protein